MSDRPTRFVAEWVSGWVGKSEMTERKACGSAHEAVDLAHQRSEEGRADAWVLRQELQLDEDHLEATGVVRHVWQTVDRSEVHPAGLAELFASA